MANPHIDPIPESQDTQSLEVVFIGSMVDVTVVSYEHIYALYSKTMGDLVFGIRLVNIRMIISKSQIEF